MGFLNPEGKGRKWCSKATSGFVKAVSWLKRPFFGCIGIGDAKLAGTHALVVPIPQEAQEGKSGMSDSTLTDSQFDEPPSRLSFAEPALPPALPFKGCQQTGLPDDGETVCPGAVRQLPDNDHTCDSQKKLVPGTIPSPEVHGGNACDLPALPH
jgi:hypothetical protein